MKLNKIHSNVSVCDSPIAWCVFIVLFFLEFQMPSIGVLRHSTWSQGLQNNLPESITLLHFIKYFPLLPQFSSPFQNYSDDQGHFPLLTDSAIRNSFWWQFMCFAAQWWLLLKNCIFKHGNSTSKTLRTLNSIENKSWHINCQICNSLHHLVSFLMWSVTLLNGSNVWKSMTSGMGTKEKHQQKRSINKYLIRTKHEVDIFKRHRRKHGINSHLWAIGIGIL